MIHQSNLKLFFWLGGTGKTGRASLVMCLFTIALSGHNTYIADDVKRALGRTSSRFH